MNEMNSIILLDGVGINLKSSICERLRLLGLPILGSESWFYMNEWKKLYPGSMQYVTKFFTRLMAEKSAFDAIGMVKLEPIPLIVDRSAVNHLIWGILKYNDIVENWFPDKEDRDLLIHHRGEYARLEAGLPIKRILISNESDFLIGKGLDESLYETDLHTATRLDTFYDPETYKSIRDHYNRLYRSISAETGTEVEEWVIGNDLDDDYKIDEWIKDRINNLMSYIKSDKI